MATKKYTSSSDIKNYWLTTIAPNYFDFDNTNNYQSGIFGYINEIMGNTTEDAFNAINIARREFYPNSAQNIQSLYKMATLQEIDLPMVTPGTAKAVLIIPVNDIINASTYSDGIYTCTIDNTLSILADDIPFILEYPIIIISKKSGNAWIHTSHYDVSVSNSLETSTAKYVVNKTISENGTSYLLLSVILRQAEIQTITEIVTKDSLLETTTQDFTFDGDLASFEVFYAETIGGTETQLKKVLKGGTIPQVPFCYYELIDDSTIRLTFPPNSYFTLAFNSQLKMSVYTSMGADGNFDSFNGSLTCVPNSENYPENNTMFITGKINGSCTNGADKDTLEEYRQKIINAYSTNNTITTSNDLQLYFDDMTSESANKVLFRKKRDDALIRMYGAYCLLKDTSENVIPSNTINVNFKRSELSENLSDNRLFIKPGTLMEYEPNIGTVVNYDCTTVSADDITIYDDLAIYDNNTYILYKSIYANALFVCVGSNGTIITSENGITWTKRHSNITNHLYDVTYGNGLYVTIGDTGTILTSPDGIIWTSRTSGTIKYLRGVTYCDTYFIAVGDNACMLISTDGITWTSVNIGSVIPSIATKSIKKAVYGNGYYLAVGEDGLMIRFINSGEHTDILQPNSWELFSTTSLTTSTINNIIFDGTQFIGVGVTGVTIKGTTTDIATWSALSSYTTYTLNNIKFFNNVYYVCGVSGIIKSSSDLVTWTDLSTSNTNTLYSLAYSGSIYVASGDDGTILNSATGASWINKPIRFLFTNPFLIAITLNPTVVGEYLNAVNSSRSITYSYVNDSTLTQFIASSLKIKRNSIMGENFYKFTINLSPASDLDYSTIITVNDTTATENQIRATKTGQVSKVYHNGTNVIATITYTDGTSIDIPVSSYYTLEDSAYVYHTGYNMNFDAGESFVIGDVLATKKVTDLGKLRAVGDFIGILYDNNMYIPFFIENYDATNNSYELSAYISTDDSMTLEADVLITNGIYQADGIENTNVSIDMNGLDMDIHVFYKNDDINYSHKYANFDYVKDYTLTNTYTNQESDNNDKISLIHQIDFIRNTMSFSEIEGDAEDYLITIKEIPVAQALWCKTYANYEYLIKSIYDNYTNLYDVYYLLENNFGIDLKFYNTYGKSKFFKVGIRNDTQILDNINCTFSFGIYLTSLTTSITFVNDFKTWIKDYIESTNYVTSDGQSIYIMNMIAAAKAAFSEVGYIEYYGFNSYNYKTQKIESLTDDQISASGLREYIPEFINIRTVTDGTTVTPKINITLLD